jgi:opacity protein-like surface antigen
LPLVLTLFLAHVALAEGLAMFTPIKAFHPVASTALAVLIGLGGAGAASAQEEDNVSGPYVGAGYGEFDVKIDDLEGVDDVLEDLDTDDSAFRVFFGWRFNPYISLEADYIDLGNPRGNFDASGSSGDYEVELAGFAGYLIGTLPIGIFELSAKVGYYFHDVDLTVDLEGIGSGDGDVLESSDNGEAVVYGIGAGVTFIEHINVNLEYELMDIDDFDDANVLWITGAWRF